MIAERMSVRRRQSARFPGPAIDDPGMAERPLVLLPGVARYAEVRAPVDVVGGAALSEYGPPGEYWPRFCRDRRRFVVFSAVGIDDKTRSAAAFKMTSCVDRPSLAVEAAAAVTWCHFRPDDPETLARYVAAEIAAMGPAPWGLALYRMDSWFGNRNALWFARTMALAAFDGCPSDGEILPG